MRTPLTLLVVALALQGCALLGKSQPVVARYFTPEYDGEAAAAPARPGLRLRLGQVEGSTHLRERVASRGAAREYFYYEVLRWTERPEVYLRRAVARTLFEERGVVEALSGRAASLDLELIAFEEVEPPRRARLQVRLLLRDGRQGLLEETVTVEQPVAPSAGADRAPALIEALSLALRAGVGRIADRVVERLAEPPAATAARDGGP